MPRVVTGRCGGVVLLDVALARYPDKPIVVYNRTSSHGQAGRRKKLLHEKTAAVVGAVREAAPGRQVTIVEAIEEGKLISPHRRELVRARKRPSAVARSWSLAT